MTKKIIPLLVMAMMLAIGSSLLAQEALEPLEVTISSEGCSAFYQTTSIHLEKGQELVVNVQDPDKEYHNAEVSNDDIDNDDFSTRPLYAELENGSYSLRGYWEYLKRSTPDCLKKEINLNENGDPLTYHFKAAAVSGTCYIYFFYFYAAQQRGHTYNIPKEDKWYNPSASANGGYLSQCIELTVN